MNLHFHIAIRGRGCSFFFVKLSFIYRNEHGERERKRPENMHICVFKINTNKEAKVRVLKRAISTIS